jgi:hypothetical protein
MKRLITLLLISLVALMGCTTTQSTPPPVQVQDVYTLSGELYDVSGGQASGTARATYQDGTYALISTFSDLPDPQGTDFYEGWIVKTTAGVPTSVISTGRALKAGASYTNPYSSAEDLRDHTFYVLTLEPDDGDPAPAAHILEGTLK